MVAAEAAVAEDETLVAATGAADFRRGEDHRPDEGFPGRERGLCEENYLELKQVLMLLFFPRSRQIQLPVSQTRSRQIHLPLSQT